MNVETINKLAKDLVEENSRLKIVGHLQNIITALNSIVTQPNQPQHQANLTTYLNNFYQAVSNSNVNELSPAWYQILVELNIYDIFGNILKERVENILNTNSITPANAKQELDLIFNKLNITIKGFENTVQGLKSLNIGYNELEQGECEIGILIPRSFIDNNLENFGKEIKELTFIFNNFSEFFHGKKIPLELKALSTTDPLITFATITTIAAGIAKTTGFIIDNYKKLLEIKKLKNELKNQGLSETELKGIDDHSNDYMAKKIDELIEALDKEYNIISDNGRKKEVLNGLRISLNKIANRIDSGFNFEVRVFINNEQNENEIDNENQKLLDEIKVATHSLQFLKLEGDPILSLPEDKNV
ncbi:MAG: hypothetical protein COA39_009435 [Sulfurimonas sp.]|nr:hypothetical protein [Sulfurimonas sp.]